MDSPTSIEAAGAPARSASALRVATLEPWLNAGWVALGAALCTNAVGLGLFGPGGPESGLFPFMAGVMLVMSGLMLAFDRRSRVPAEQTFWCEPTAARRVVSLVLAILVLLLLVRFLGFLPAALASMPVLLLLIEKRSLGFALLVGTVTTLAVYGLFVRLLGMPMPRGMLGI